MSTGKVKRALWTNSHLKQAVNAVIQNGMSKKRASIQFGIPRPTLIPHIDKATHGQGVERKLSRPQILNEEDEKELSAIIQDMESRLFGLSESDVKKIVYDYCEKKGIKNQFSEDSRVIRTMVAYNMITVTFLNALTDEHI
jgi:transposase-like protein